MANGSILGVQMELTTNLMFYQDLKLCVNLKDGIYEVLLLTRLSVASMANVTVISPKGFPCGHRFTSSGNCGFLWLKVQKF